MAAGVLAGQAAMNNTPGFGQQNPAEYLNQGSGNVGGFSFNSQPSSWMPQAVQNPNMSTATLQPQGTNLAQQQSAINQNAATKAGNTSAASALGQAQATYGPQQLQTQYGLMGQYQGKQSVGAQMFFQPLQQQNKSQGLAISAAQQVGGAAANQIYNQYGFGNAGNIGSSAAPGGLLGIQAAAVPRQQASNTQVQNLQQQALSQQERMAMNQQQGQAAASGATTTIGNREAQGNIQFQQQNQSQISAAQYKEAQSELDDQAKTIGVNKDYYMQNMQNGLQALGYQGGVDSASLLSEWNSLSSADKQNVQNIAEWYSKYGSAYNALAQGQPAPAPTAAQKKATVPSPTSKLR